MPTPAESRTAFLKERGTPASLSPDRTNHTATDRAPLSCQHPCLGRKCVQESRDSSLVLLARTEVFIIYVRWLPPLSARFILGPCRHASPLQIRTVGIPTAATACIRQSHSASEILRVATSTGISLGEEERLQLVSADLARHRLSPPEKNYGHVPLPKHTLSTITRNINSKKQGHIYTDKLHGGHVENGKKLPRNAVECGPRQKATATRPVRTTPNTNRRQAASGETPLTTGRSEACRTTKELVMEVVREGSSRSRINAH